MRPNRRIPACDLNSATERASGEEAQRENEKEFRKPNKGRVKSMKNQCSRAIASRTRRLVP